MQYSLQKQILCLACFVDSRKEVQLAYNAHF